MALFRPYQQGQTEPGEPKPERKGRGATRADLVTASPAPPEEHHSPVVDDNPELAGSDVRRQPRKKGAPTPTRAQAEAARMERLHPTLSPKERKRADRQAAREQRVRAMSAVEDQPARRLVRDHVDARLTLTEWTIPLMLGVMAVTLAFPRNYTVQQVSSIAMLALFLLWILNIVVVRRSLHRIAAARGIDVRQRGLFMYMVNRMMTLRAMRRPEPRIGRGEAY